MTALRAEIYTEFCPEARADAIFDGGKCRYCHTDHKVASKLTRSQRQTLRLLAHGHTRQQIAAQLATNYNTLNHQWRDARLIAGAKTTEQLIAMLAREGSV